MFINRDVKGQSVTTELTSEQKIKICDLYSQGEDAMSIKHLMIKDFTPGYAFGHLIKPAINKMNEIQSTCTTLMSGAMVDDAEKGTFIPAPKTEAELITVSKGYYANCDENAFGELVKLVVKATGTWTQYKNSFKQD